MVLRGSLGSGFVNTLKLWVVYIMPPLSQPMGSGMSKELVQSSHPTAAWWTVSWLPLSMFSRMQTDLQ